VYVLRKRLSYDEELEDGREPIASEREEMEKRQMALTKATLIYHRDGK
jgi:hypothetical protein